MWSEICQLSDLKINTQKRVDYSSFHASYTETSSSGWFSCFKVNADSIQAENRFKDNEKMHHFISLRPSWIVGLKQN